MKSFLAGGRNGPKSTFKSTSEDGKLNNLQELTELGQNFLICCLHLLLEPESKEKTTFETTTFETFKWIKENGKLQIGRAQISKIINSWVASSTKSCQSDINLTENEWEKTKSYESETKLIENDLKITAQSKVLKKNQRKCKKIHKNPPPKNKDKIAELKSLLKNQCGNHSIKSMADNLEINVNTAMAWIHRDKITFQKHDGPCHFCDIRMQRGYKGEYKTKMETLDTKQKNDNLHKHRYNIQKEIDLDVVKKQCGNHTMEEMATTLKISKRTIMRWKTKYKITWYSSETVDCIFCKNPTIDKSNSSREIGLDMLKKQCGDHSREEMAKVLKVNPATLWLWEKKYEITYSRETGDCSFCVMRTIIGENYFDQGV